MKDATEDERKKKKKNEAQANMLLVFFTDMRVINSCAYKRRRTLLVMFKANIVINATSMVDITIKSAKVIITIIILIFIYIKTDADGGDYNSNHKIK